MHSLALLRTTSSIVALSLVNTAQAAPQRVYDTSLFHAHPSAPMADNPTRAFQTDEFTGSFQYTVRIEVPPARAGATPSLALNYGSSSGNGWIGVGWNLDVGHIERDTRKGLPIHWTTGSPSSAAIPMDPLRYDDAGGFVFSLGGQSSRLVLVSPATNEYRAEIDRTQLRFQLLDAGLSTNRWEVVEKSGARHVFGFTGESAHSQLTNPNSTASGSARVARWGLSSSTDTNGNRVLYEYVAQPSWTGEARRTPLYLSKVKYNGHTSDPAFTHEVAFDLEDRGLVGTPDRDDTFSYRFGFRTETRKRLALVTPRVLIEGTWTAARMYRLKYVLSPSTGRSLLDAIEMLDASRLLLAHPPMRFTYSQQDFEFENPVSWGPLAHQTNPGDPTNALEQWNALGCKQTALVPGSIFASNGKVDLVDLDRDGLPDRALIDRIYTIPGSPPARYLAQHNRAGLGGTLDAQLRPHTFAGYTGPSLPGLRGGFGWMGASSFPTCDLNDLGKSYLKLADINGDGFVDRIHDWRRGSTSAVNQLFVEYGFGRGFEAPVPFGPIADQTALAGATFSPGYFSTPWNSPEYVLNDCDHAGGMPCNPTVCPGAAGNNTIGALVATLLDVNGDSLPDRVVRRGNETLTARNHFLVQLNTGNGFEPYFKRWSFAAPYSTDQYYWNNVMTFDIGDQAAPSTSTTVGMFDMNGDGLPDRVSKLASVGANGWNQYVVQFNTGFGWTPFSAANSNCFFGQLRDPETPYDAHVPEPFGGCSGTASASPDGPQGSFTVLMLQDVNNDGLLDRVMQKRSPGVTAGYYTMYVQINRGMHFDAIRSWANLYAPNTAQFPGYPEAWHYLQASISYVSANDMGNQEVVQFRDINGDGLPDRVMRTPNAPYANGWLVQIAKGQVADQLVTARNGLGARIDVAYEPATRHVNRDIDVGANTTDPWATGAVGTLSSPIATVSEVRVNDGLQTTDAITRYEYYGGLYDFVEREFRGFYCVSKIDPAGAVTKTYFHQDGGLDGTLLGEHQDGGAHAKRGQPFRVEVYASNATHPLVVTVNKVAEMQLSSGLNRWFPFVAQTTTLNHEGLATSRAAAETFSYYAPGHPFAANMERSTKLGEVTGFNSATHGFANVASSDDLVHELTYTTIGGAPDIKDRVDFDRWKGFDGAILRQTDNDYVAVTANLTQTRRWLDVPSPTWITESFTHDAWGNVQDHVRPADGSESNPSGTGDTITRRSTWDPDYHCFVRETIDDYGPGKLAYTTTTTHDPRSGQLLTSTDWNGVVTRNLYDSHYRLYESWLDTPGEPSVWRQRFLYSFNGAAGGSSQNWVLRSVNDGEDAANGHVTRTYSDGYGRAVRACVEAEGVNQYRVVDTRYDARGNADLVTRERFETGRAFAPLSTLDAHTLTEFDALNRPIRLRPPLGDGSLSPTGVQTTQHGEGSDPWVRVLRDAQWNTTGTGMQKREHLDGFGRVWRVDEIVSSSVTHTTTYDYDRFNQLTRIVDARGNVSSFVYDSLGRRITSFDPDRGASTTSYFATGNVQIETDALGHRTEHAYDHLGRITRTLVFPNGTSTPSETLRFVFDANLEGSAADYPVFKGQLFRADDAEGSTRHGYDIRGRILRTRRDVTRFGSSFVTKFEHDAVGKLRTLTYPGATAKVRYSYDTGGNLRRIEALSGTGTVNEVFYDAQAFNELRQPVRIALGNGVVNEYEHYANSRRLQRIRAIRPGDAAVVNLVYTYDTVGNVTSITDEVPTHLGAASGTRSDIGYDGLYRLTRYTHPGESGSLTKQFTYDAIGNTLTNGDMGAGTYVYPASGAGSVRPHAVESANGISYVYDAAGNMTRRGPAGAQQVLQYDARHQLRRFVPPSGTPTTFGYDATGKRLWKQRGSSASIWIGAHFEIREGRPLCHVIADGERVCTFEPPSARLEPVLVGEPPSPRPFDYYHADHLKSSTVITRRDGSVRQAYQYSAFGHALHVQSPNADSVAHLYSDQVFDEETGLYDYGSRYFDPLLGRFIQPDGLTPDAYNPQALNPYTYVLNNPFRYIDPSGHKWLAAIKDAVKGAILGEFAGGDSGIAAAVGQLAIGLTPVGVLGDVRDFALASYRAIQGGGTIGEVLSAGANLIPGVSEGRKLVKLVGGAAEVASGVIRHADEFADAAKATGNAVSAGASASRSADEIGAAATGVPTDAKYAQATYSSKFSVAGNLRGKDVDDVTSALRSER